ncbi:MAG TPA: tryptophan--tRNA ligase, partial [Pyrinomonadaceae bacterium]|nr:tryptophan--tRNA ligase [Pyrinomonadaceae bacterium]
KSRDLARIYLAVGIDPDVSTVFVQSDVPQHTELAWLLNCVTRMSELERMTQFKDKARKQAENVAVGYFDYPVLMAADILLYQTDLVPVGEDQKQHLELTRDIAVRFNRDYGETFRLPDPFIPRVGARIMSLADPAKKMSKSDAESEAGCIMLLDEADAVRRKFKRAVTDSGTEIRFDAARPAINNLMTIYHLLTGKTSAESEEHFSGKGYGKLKEELADVTIEFLKPFQERVRAIDDAKLDEILEQGAARAESIAARTMSQARANMGLVGAKSSDVAQQPG